jgi:UDP-GlcNAc:undecaprenyl-phosphate GlcNAc-1-phosphate transferase
MFADYLAVFLLSALLIFGVRRYASRFGLVDIPNERSSHKETIARGAGIGFSAALLIIFTLFHFDIAFTYKWSLLAILLVFIIGVLDDRHDTSPNTKFIVIFIGTFLLSLDGIIINDLGTYWGEELSLGWLALPFTMFAVSGFTNALNLIDGLDGLSATVSIVILSVYAMVGYQYHDTFIFLFSTLLIVSLLAFLLYNWHPATIFMGDSGSLTLGFIISVIAIKSLAYMPTVSVLFVAALPILDTLVVMIRRKRAGKSVFTPDRCHIHHILLHYFKGDIRKTVLLLAMIQLIYSAIGMQMDKQMDEGLLLILFLVNVVLLYLFLQKMIERGGKSC